MSTWKLGKTQYSFLETATSGGTLVLTASSAQFQIFTGSSNHTVRLPNATTTSNGSGIIFTIVNESTGDISVELNDTTVLTSVSAGSSKDIILINHSTSNGTWRVASFTGTAGGGMGSVDPGDIISSAARGLWAGGYGVSNTIDYINMATFGNATDFGDLTVGRIFLSACSSSTRGLFAGSISGGVATDIIDYVTIATTGNATDFGDLTVARGDLAACSNATRGLFGGGLNNGGGVVQNVIDYVTIATTGNATNFGNLTQARQYLGSLSSNVQGVFAGGYTNTAGNAPSNQSTIDYVTIATTGNAASFGNLTVARGYIAACSSRTRGVFAGGSAAANALSDVIDYITIATTGNAQDFGDLLFVNTQPAGCSSLIKSFFGGGYNGSITVNVIQYVITSTLSNAQDFGDLTRDGRQFDACSNAHGGL